MHATTWNLVGTATARLRPDRVNRAPAKLNRLGGVIRANLFPITVCDAQHCLRTITATRPAHRRRCQPCH